MLRLKRYLEPSSLEVAYASAATSISGHIFTPYLVQQSRLLYNSGHNSSAAGAHDVPPPASKKPASNSERTEVLLPASAPIAVPLAGWLRGPITNMPGLRIEDEWVEDHDNAGRPCWRSLRNGELTPPGIKKPVTWLEVVDKKTGLIYYWCRATGETTQLGEPRPGMAGRRTISQDSAEADELFGVGHAGKAGQKQSEDPSFMVFIKNPVTYVLLGFGVITVCYELYRSSTAT